MRILLYSLKLVKSWASAITFVYYRRRSMGFVFYRLPDTGRSALATTSAVTDSKPALLNQTILNEVFLLLSATCHNRVSHMVMKS
jgi:hypothetical protein